MVGSGGFHLAGDPVLDLQAFLAQAGDQVILAGILFGFDDFLVLLQVAGFQLPQMGRFLLQRLELLRGHSQVGVQVVLDRHSFNSSVRSGQETSG